jgi:outer membrane protein assembly factor BamE (lipoprotein component of BamABCDE complex)
MITRTNRLKVRIAYSQSLLIFLMLLPAATGCFMPTPPHGGFGVITNDSIEFIEPAKTTRADVLLRLGNPNHRSDEQFFVYRWSRVHGFVSVGFAGGGDIQKEHFLAIEFAPDNHVARFKLIDPWIFQTSRTLLADWIIGKDENSASAP